MKKLLPIFAATMSLVVAACDDSAPVTGLRYLDQYSMTGDVNFWKGIDPGPVGDTVTAVVEIPANTNQKWEVCGPSQVADATGFPECQGTQPGERIVWEVKSGARRVVAFAGYPGNYGFLPRTMTADGDPLDVITIGPTVDRGNTVGAKVIGVLHCLDGADVDDKIVAVQSDSPFYAISDLTDPSTAAPYAAGLKSYLVAFFESYKGAGSMDCTTTPAGGAADAMTTVDAAKAGYTP